MRWYSLVRDQPEFVAVLGKATAVGEKGGKAAAPAAAKPSKAEAKKDAAPKKDAKKEEKGDKGKKADKKEAAPKAKAEAKKEEKKQDSPEELRKKQLKKVIKEGGKRGVEIEGAADMGGLGFFCTSVDEPDGDMEMLVTCMEAMNAESDPSEEEQLTWVVLDSSALPSMSQMVT